MSAPVVTAPGVYDLKSADYHADPVPFEMGGSLSSSGARKLLPPHCPAVFHWEREHRPTPTRAFDYGHAAHQLVLGVGPELVPIDADSWRTKDAREQRDEAHAAGKVPILVDEYKSVTAMAEAIRKHPIASALLRPGSGNAERALFWQDAESSVWRRAMLDWLPNSTDARMVIPDYKTARSASPAQFQKSLVDFGYHQQAPWYIDAVQALGLAAEAAFVFIVQEKTPPYLVSVIEPDAQAIEIGRALNRRAIEIYAECTRTGDWPGYANDVELVGVPGWYAYRYEEGVL